MTTFTFKDPRIERQRVRVHHEGAIRGALKAVNDHKTGIPEFIKNSAGAYHRSTVGPSKEQRTIVLLFRTPRRGRNGAIGCLDLVGMTETDMSLFQNWFDPTAASRGDPSGIVGRPWQRGKVLHVKDVRTQLVCDRNGQPLFQDGLD